MKWTTTRFVLAGVTAALTFAVAFALGAGVIIVTGIPATGGLANILVAVTFATTGALIARVPGFSTLVVTLVFTMAVPTVVGGPPGPQKIVNGLLIGLAHDLVLLILGRDRAVAYIVGGASAAMVSILSIWGTMVVLHLPGVEKLQPLVLPLTGVQAVLGAAGGYLGVRVYRGRLSNLSVVKRLGGGEPPSLR